MLRLCPFLFLTLYSSCSPPPTFYYEEFQTYKEVERIVQQTPVSSPPRLYSYHFAVLALLHNHSAIPPSTHQFILVLDEFLSKLQTSEHTPSQILEHACHEPEFNTCLYLGITGDKIYSEMLRS